MLNLEMVKEYYDNDVEYEWKRLERYLYDLAIKVCEREKNKDIKEVQLIKKYNDNKIERQQTSNVLKI